LELVAAPLDDGDAALLVRAATLRDIRRRKDQNPSELGLGATGKFALVM
jgi:hypothetical protein